MAEMQAPQGGAPQPAPEGAPAGPEGGAGDPAEAFMMVGKGLQTLIATAPSPELAQQLEAIMGQVEQVLQQAQSGQGSPAGQPVSPEAGGAPGAVPVG